MAYDIWIKGLRLPIAPESIQITSPSLNEKYVSANNQEFVVPKKRGLREIEFEALLPNQEYPFAVYYDDEESEYIESGNKFKGAKAYLSYIEALKYNKMSFQLLIVRQQQNGEDIYSDNITVVLEDYSIVDNVENGYDTVVNLKFCEYVEQEATVYETTEDGLESETERESKTAPKAPVSYTVKSGDTLWKLAKKYYNDGSKYDLIVQANKGTIKNPNLIYVGQVIKIPQT